MDVPQTRAHHVSRIFLVLFFFAVCASIGVTYYHTIMQKDYAVFTDSETVPNAADFFVYLVDIVGSYFGK